MPEQISIAALGTDESIQIYNSVGFKTYYSEDFQKIDKKIYEFYKEGCKIIFVTEKIYINITETLEKYRQMTYPIILPLPLDNVNSGIGMNKIKANVEKAIGINIF